MTTLEAVRRGMRALAGMRRMCLIFYAALSVAALLIVAPVMAVAFRSLGSSAWAGELTANLNVQWIGELLANYGRLPALQILPVFAGLWAVSLMVDLFLLGGALELFCRHEPFSMSAFFAGCGRNFAVLIRLGLVSAVFYGGASLVWFAVSSLGDVFWGQGSAATPLVHWSWFSAAIGLGLFGMVNLVFDYARIHAVAQKPPGAWRCTVAAARFVAAHRMPAVKLYAALWLLALVAVSAYFAFARLLGSPAASAVLTLFLVRQAAAFAKVWLRLLFYSAQVELFDALTPRAVAPGVEPPPLPERAVPAESFSAAPETESPPGSERVGDTSNEECGSPAGSS